MPSDAGCIGPTGETGETGEIGHAESAACPVAPAHPHGATRRTGARRGRARPDHVGGSVRLPATGTPIALDTSSANTIRRSTTTG